jgi:hypothetical protein
MGNFLCVLAEYLISLDIPPRKEDKGYIMLTPENWEV